MKMQRRHIIGLVVVLLAGFLDQNAANGQASSFAYADLETISITAQAIADPQDSALSALLPREVILEVAHSVISAGLSTARAIKVMKYDGSSEMTLASNLIVAIQLVVREPEKVAGASDLKMSGDFAGLGSISTKTHRSAWPLNVQPGFFELRSEVMVLSRDSTILKKRLTLALERQLQPLCASILARNGEKK